MTEIIEQESKIKLIKNQQIALAMLLSHKVTLLYGGGRSGKSFIIMMFQLLLANLYDPERAANDPDYPLKQPIRQLILRRKYTDVKKSIIRETLPEVADMLGYDNVCTFSRFFTSKTGMSPSSFMKNHL